MTKEFRDVPMNLSEKLEGDCTSAVHAGQAPQIPPPSVKPQRTPYEKELALNLGDGNMLFMNMIHEIHSQEMERAARAGVVEEKLDQLFSKFHYAFTQYGATVKWYSFDDESLDDDLLAIGTNMLQKLCSRTRCLVLPPVRKTIALCRRKENSFQIPQ